MMDSFESINRAAMSNQTYFNQVKHLEKEFEKVKIVPENERFERFMKRMSRQFRPFLRQNKIKLFLNIIEENE